MVLRIPGPLRSWGHEPASKQPGRKRPPMAPQKLGEWRLQLKMTDVLWGKQIHLYEILKTCPINTKRRAIFCETKKSLEVVLVKSNEKQTFGKETVSKNHVRGLDHGQVRTGKTKPMDLWAFPRKPTDSSCKKNSFSFTPNDVAPQQTNNPPWLVCISSPVGFVVVLGVSPHSEKRQRPGVSRRVFTARLGLFRIQGMQDEDVRQTDVL